MPSSRRASRAGASRVVAVPDPRARLLARSAVAGLVAVVVTVALLIGAPPASAQRGPDNPGPRTPALLALGDSVAAGVGASDPATTGYVPLVADAVRARAICGASDRVPCRRLETEDVSVSGATTTTLIAEQLPAALSILAARNGNRIPTDDVEVITLDIGGNDVFPLVQVCGAGFTPECVAAAEQALTTVAVNLDTIVGQLRAAAGPDTDIVVMTYYNPLPGCALSALAPVADVVLEGGPGLEVGLNDLVRTTAARYDATVAETYGALGPDDFVGGQDCLHPDDSGHAIIADVITAALDQ